jgi:uncharacterized protein (DUF362 family)
MKSAFFKFNSEKKITRRSFIKTGALAGAALSLKPTVLFADEKNKKTDVWVIHGEDKKKLMKKCLEIISANGGLGGKKGSLALKVNSAWARTPEEGANTDPILVDEFIKGCKSMGVKKVVLPENPCASAKYAFTKSGILAVAKENGVKMINLAGKSGDFKEVEIPEGKSLKSALVAKEFLDADIVIDMPVAKHHGGATLSIAMKNWMGAVKDRRYWHRNNLHQCIADFCTFMKPDWAIVDATKIMLDKGPQGPTSNMKYPNLLIVSKNQVAADAYSATLFHDIPTKVKYIKYAGQMGLGPVELSEMNIHKVEA